MRLLIGLFIVLLHAAANAANMQTIGVLAFEGRDKALNRWQATADYLSENIPSAAFRISPLNHEEFIHAINKGELDFVLTNPAHHAQLNVKFGVSRIATFIANPFGQATTNFSSVIFTRADSDIHSLLDLKGARLAAVSKNAFGGYQVARRLLLENGLDALTDMDLLWMGFPHSDVVKAVLKGKADAGVVRSGVLENMAYRGEIELGLLRILAERSNDGFPLLHSTDLYPEWPFARLPGTDLELSRQVAMTLMSMPSDHPAAIRSLGAGWTIPLSDSSVHEVLRELQVTPYQLLPLTFPRVLKTYGHWLVVIALLLAVGLLSGMRLLRANSELRVTQGRLQKSQGELEEALRLRTGELEKTRYELEHTLSVHEREKHDVNSACGTMQTLYDIMLRADLSWQQRINAMVEAVRQYLCCDVGILYRVLGDNYEIRSISPANINVELPVHSDAVAQAVSSRKLYQSSETANGASHVVCPVFVQGELHCLLAFANNTPSAQGGVFSDLGLTLLELTAQWIANEIQLDEQHASESIQLDVARTPFKGITKREKQVLHLLVQGNPNKIIARSLGLSPKTVEMHRANLIRKAGAKSSTELVQLAVTARLFSEIQ